MTEGSAEYEEAFELAKLQAVVDGAFDERLLRLWFRASWELCAAMIGLEFPAREISEQVAVQPDGTIRLTRKPIGQVRLYSCGSLVAIMPKGSPLLSNGGPNLPNPYTGFGQGDGDWYLTCGTSLCCYCDLVARYQVGSSDPCSPMPAGFTQAVMRLFCYQCENRGEAPMDDDILGKSGAFAFLAPQVTYVL